MKGAAMIQPLSTLCDSLQVEETLVEINKDGSTAMMIVNKGETTCELKVGMIVGQGIGAEVIH